MAAATLVRTPRKSWPHAGPSPAVRSDRQPLSRCDSAALPQGAGAARPVPGQRASPALPGQRPTPAPGSAACGAHSRSETSATGRASTGRVTGRCPRLGPGDAEVRPPRPLDAGDPSPVARPVPPVGAPDATGRRDREGGRVARRPGACGPRPDSARAERRAGSPEPADPVEDRARGGLPRRGRTMARGRPAAVLGGGRQTVQWTVCPVRWPEARRAPGVDQNQGGLPR